MAFAAVTDEFASTPVQVLRGRFGRTGLTDDGEDRGEQASRDHYREGAGCRGVHDVSFFIEWLNEPNFAERVVGCTCDVGASCPDGRGGSA